MCNFYNTSNTNGYSGCGYGSYNNGCNSYGLFGCARQWICRDCNGTIFVNQRNSGCGCQHHCGCQQNCGCGCSNGTSGNSSGGNGGFACFTVCGNSNTSTTLGNGDLYYARQYGLYPFGYNRGCGCTLDALSQT